MGAISVGVEKVTTPRADIIAADMRGIWIKSETFMAQAGLNFNFMERGMTALVAIGVQDTVAL